MPGRRLRRACTAVLAVLLVTTACSDDRGHDVLAPGAVVEGGDDAISLLGQYWKGMLELPRQRPARTGEGTCDPGLSAGAVFFAPTLTMSGSGAVRCAAPEGATVVVLPASVVCVEEGIDKADLACLESMWDLTSSSVVVDGRAEDELTRYEVDSEQFEVDLGERNTIGVRPGPHRAVARGQVVMVDGLSRGAHVIEIAARFGRSGAATLTIELEVVPAAG